MDTRWSLLNKKKVRVARVFKEFSAQTCLDSINGFQLKVDCDTFCYYFTSNIRGAQNDEKYPESQSIFDINSHVAVPAGVLAVVLHANGQIVDADLTRASFTYVMNS